MRTGGISTTPAYAAATSTRALDTTFTPNATKPTFVSYTIRFVVNGTDAASKTGTVELRSDTAATPTTVRCAVALTNAITTLLGAITVGLTQDATLTYVVPPGHNVKLVSSGSATISISQQSEVTIG